MSNILMRCAVIFWALIAVLFLPVETVAEKTDPGSVEDAEERGVVGEACFGDRYESDNDINEGNRITDEEIFLLLNRPGS